MMTKCILFGFTILSFLALVGCGVVSDEQALREFIKDYPNATIFEQFVGEGDSNTTYMHFRYTEAGSKEKHEVMWVYQKQKDGSWKVINKSKPKVPGAIGDVPRIYGLLNPNYLISEWHASKSPYRRPWREN